MAKMKKRIIKCSILLIVLISIFTAITVHSKSNPQQTNAQINDLSEKVEDGTIFHAFAWSLNTIKDNMKNIAKAGFSAIQTSPINKCDGENTPLILNGKNPDGSNGAWWWHYQPTDYKIGNYQVGTKQDLINMCNEADKYGIKIIIDVPANHTSTNIDNVSQDLINAANNRLYHDTGFIPIKNWSDRLDCTRNSVINLPDIDTENIGFQNYLINYLNDCIDCGVDGFKFSSAKHIGLPNDNKPIGVKNNFWTRIINETKNNDKLFNYGEVIQGNTDKINDYINTIGAATATNFGYSLRYNITYSDLEKYSIDQNHGINNINDTNFITWVESYDNYLNQNTIKTISDTEIKLVWAIITSRKNGTPLFFDRPLNASKNNIYGINKIGIAGSDLYKDDEIAAVNFFRNHMKNKSEFLINPNDNNNVLIIERGTKGAVIVNASDKTVSINCDTNLSSGKYQSWTDDRSLFEVSNEKLIGNIPAKSVRVIMPVKTKIPAFLNK